MPPKKKAAGGGDAAKGEKVFKNLCSACHSLSVRLSYIQYSLNIIQLWSNSYDRRTQLDLPSEVSVVQTSHQEKVSTTHLLLPPRLHWSGLTVTSTSGSSHQLVSHLVMPWHSLVLAVPRIVLIWLLTLRVVERARFYHCCLDSAARIYLQPYICCPNTYFETCACPAGQVVSYLTTGHDIAWTYKLNSFAICIHYIPKS